jgi:hypothetical protein
MKNLYSKNEFLIERNKIIQESFLNEGLFDFIGKVFNKAKGIINKVRGGKKIEAIYQKYIKLMNDKILKETGIDMKLGVQEAKPEQGKETAKQEPAKNQPQVQTTQPAQSQTKATESYSLIDNDILYEANPISGGIKKVLKDAAGNIIKDNVDKMTTKVTDKVKNFVGGNKNDQNKDPNQPKKQGGEQVVGEEQAAGAEKEVTADEWKQKQGMIQKIYLNFKKQAENEMNAALKKFGEGNPKLQNVVNNMLLQIDLDLDKAKFNYSKKFNDTATANKLTAEMNKKTKQINASLDSISKGGAADAATINVGGKEFKVGVPYPFKTLTDEIKTIKITKQNDDKSVYGQFVSTVLGDIKEQPFGVDRILLPKDFVPVEGDQYSFINSKGKLIKGTIISKSTSKGYIKIKTGESPKGFYVPVGSIMKLESDKTPVTPAVQTAGGQSQPQTQAQPQAQPKVQGATEENAKKELTPEQKTKYLELKKEWNKKNGKKPDYNPGKNIRNDLKKQAKEEVK